MKRINIWFIVAFFWGMAVTHNALLMNERQNYPTLVQTNIMDVFKKEFRFFLSSVFWEKVDTYGHFGDWEKEEKDGKVEYYSVFKYQKEFVPLLKASVALDESFSQRVALLANTMAVSLGKVEEAQFLLRRAIGNHPKQERIFRLYGEMGLIAHQIEKNHPKALRWFEKCFSNLNRVKEGGWTRQDEFNLNLYGLSASLSAYLQKDYNLAYQYYKMGHFNNGSGEYQIKMEQILKERGEEELRKSVRLRRKDPNYYNEDDEHDHDHEHGEHHDEHEHHDAHNENAVSGIDGKPYISKKDVLIAQAEKKKEIFLYMIPQVNEHLYFPINKNFACVLGIGLVFLLLAVFNLKFFKR
jgi:tetratricopeptide (TPR) repeat protein